MNYDNLSKEPTFDLLLACDTLNQAKKDEIITKEDEIKLTKIKHELKQRCIS